MQTGCDQGTPTMGKIGSFLTPIFIFMYLLGLCPKPPLQWASRPTNQCIEQVLTHLFYRALRAKQIYQLDLNSTQLVLTHQFHFILNLAFYWGSAPNPFVQCRASRPYTIGTIRGPHGPLIVCIIWVLTDPYNSVQNGSSRTNSIILSSENISCKTNI